MIMPPHRLNGNLIDASAGTGKTYQLASRFIALLALGLPSINFSIGTDPF